jgi:hypothetical protein
MTEELDDQNQNAQEVLWPAKVELTANERVQVINLLPREGNLAVVRQIRLLRSALNFTAEERPAPAPQTAPGMPARQPLPPQIPPKTITITRVMWDLIVTQLTDLEKTKRLPVDFLELYEKFVEAKPGARTQ